jgi:Cu+-exporting ATPase
MMVLFAVELGLAQCGSCQQGSGHMGIGSSSTPNSYKISFNTVSGDTYNLAKVVGSEPALIFRLGGDSNFDTAAALVKKTRAAVPESSMVFIAALLDTSSKALVHTKKLKLNFPVLFDPGNKLIAKFGLSEESPAVIFLDRDGKVVQSSSEVNEEVLNQGIAAATAPAQAVDPVCQMTVNKRTAAATYQYQGTTYYFCSSACKNLFTQNPGKYLKK